MDVKQVVAEAVERAGSGAVDMSVHIVVGWTVHRAVGWVVAAVDVALNQEVADER